MLMFDSGTQYCSAIFQQFAKGYEFIHIMSGQNYLQSNGAVERAVKTIKGLLARNEDLYLTLLAHCSTPLENGYNTAELLMC